MNVKITTPKAAHALTAPRWLDPEINLDAVDDKSLLESLDGLANRMTSVADILLSAGDGDFAAGTISMLGDLLAEHAEQLSVLVKTVRGQRVTLAEGGAA